MMNGNMVANGDDVESWQRIVIELSANAPDNDVRDYIQLYNTSKATKDLKVIFKKCSKETLVSTFSYLRGVPRKLNKDNLVNSVILRIQS